MHRPLTVPAVLRGVKRNRGYPLGTAYTRTEGIHRTVTRKVWLTLGCGIEAGAIARGLSTTDACSVLETNWGYSGDISQRPEDLPTQPSTLRSRCCFALAR
jgi:hypothetical protein